MEIPEDKEPDDLANGKTPGEGNGRAPGDPDWFQRQPIPLEILEWARQDINEEEILAAIREIRETGGLEFKDILQALEKELARE